MYFKGKYEMLRRFALRFATLQTHGADWTLASDDIGHQKRQLFYWKQEC